MSVPYSQLGIVDKTVIWLLGTPHLPFRRRLWIKVACFAARRGLIESVELVERE